MWVIQTWILHKAGIFCSQGSWKLQNGVGGMELSVKGEKMDKEQVSRYRAQSWHLGTGWLDSLCFRRVIYRNTEVVWVSVCWPCTLGRRSSTLSLGSYFNTTLALSASQWRVNCLQHHGRWVGRLSQTGDLWFLKWPHAGSLCLLPQSTASNTAVPESVNTCGTAWSKDAQVS